jgi:predicted nucleic acid-binding protein
MIFDTDIFIWVERGNLRAAKAMNEGGERYLSIQTYLELIQSARNKVHLILVKRFIHDMNFEVLPLTENIGHRALVYV